MEVNQIPKEFESQKPKGKFFVSKKAVILYFAFIALLLAYMGWTAIRLPSSPNTACGSYSYAQISHAERTYAWAFVHPTGNVKLYVQTICKDLNSTSLVLPS